MTAKVDNHHSNQKYKCLVIGLLSEPWFHYKIEVRGRDGKLLDPKDYTARLVKANIIPTYEWTLDLNHEMSKWKPDFAAALTNAVIMGDFER